MEAEGSTCKNINNGELRDVDNCTIGKVVRFLMFVIGATTLLAWFVFIATAQDFAMKLNGTEGYQDTFIPSITMVQNVVTLLVSIMMVIFIHKYCIVKRVLYSAIVIALGFVALISIEHSNFGEKRLTLFMLILTVAFMLGAASTIMQTSVFSILTNFPFEYTNAFLIGQGCSGAIVTILLIICLATDQTPATTKTMFFSLTIVVCIISFLSFMYILRTPVYKKHVLSKSLSTKKCSSDIEVVSNPNPDDHETEIKKSESNSMEQSVKSNGVISDSVEIIKLIWIELASIFLGFAVLIAYFPVLGNFMESSVEDKTSSWATKYYFVVAIVLPFNVGDFAGRLIAKWIIYPDPHSIKMLIFTSLRVLFIILFFMCNWRNPRYSLNCLLVNDIFPVIFFFFFALTNGYLTTICLMKAPSHLPEHLKEKGGTLCILILGSGLLFGSIVSFGTSQI